MRVLLSYIKHKEQYHFFNKPPRPLISLPAVLFVVFVVASVVVASPVFVSATLLFTVAVSAPEETLVNFAPSIKPS